MTNAIEYVVSTKITHRFDFVVPLDHEPSKNEIISWAYYYSGNDVDAEIEILDVSKKDTAQVNKSHTTDYTKE